MCILVFCILRNVLVNRLVSNLTGVVVMAWFLFKHWYSAETHVAIAHVHKSRKLVFAKPVRFAGTLIIILAYVLIFSCCSEMQSKRANLLSSVLTCYIDFLPFVLFLKICTEMHRVCLGWLRRICAFRNGGWLRDCQLYSNAISQTRSNPRCGAMRFGSRSRPMHKRTRALVLGC